MPAAGADPVPGPDPDPDPGLGPGPDRGPDGVAPDDRTGAAEGRAAGRRSRASRRAGSALERLAATRPGPRTTVETSGGRLSGLRLGRTTSFRGVPYAEAPTGERRFRPPVPRRPWSGTRDATTFGPEPPQPSTVRRYPRGPARSDQSEDCLTLSVWTPGVDGTRRPVMVWLHGGAFTGGSGSRVGSDGSALAALGDVVVVTVDYRLGALGWLLLPDLGDGEAANLGLLDQIEALRWVRDNIEVFGGDPTNVTVFGTSAGGSSVVALLAAPDARGLIHRAIVESAPLAHTFGREAAAAVTERVVDEVGVSGPAALRHVPAERLVDAVSRVELAQGFANATDPHPDRYFCLGPVIDGRVLPLDPRRALADGASSDVPILVGTNRDEWQIFAVLTRAHTSAARLEAWLERLAGGRAQEVAGTYRDLMGDAHDAIKAAIETDVLFLVPSRRLLAARARQAPDRSYGYLFNWSSDPMVGATHAIEVPFVFGNLRPWQLSAERRLVGARPPRSLAVRVGRAWTSFARTGRPGHPHLPTWAPFADERTVAVLDERPTMEHDPLGRRVAVWDGLL